MCVKPSRIRCRYEAAFSMVEVALALGVLTFSLLTLLALLPLGVKNNQISAEESRAVNILGLLEADLRNTHPLANPKGRSQFFGLLLPYSAASPSGAYVFNTAITSPTASLLQGITTIGLDEGERIVPISVAVRPQYQASVIYTIVPGPGSLEVMQARLVVNWPAIPDASIKDLTDTSKVRGYVESAVNFVAP